jgi:hypothetical protein
VATAGRSDKSYTADLVIHNTFLFTFNSRGLGVFDIANPREPKFLKTAAEGQTLWTGCIIGGHLYAAVNEGEFGDGPRKFEGLRIFDVSNPADPKEVGSLPTWKVPYKCLPTPDRRLLALMEERVQLYDLKDPIRPVAVGQDYRASCRTGIFATADRQYLFTWGFARVTRQFSQRRHRFRLSCSRLRSE